MSSQSPQLLRVAHRLSRVHRMRAWPQDGLPPERLTCLLHREAPWAILRVKL